MKAMRLLLPTTLLCCACATSPASSAAPDFTLPDTKGNTVTGASLWQEDEVLLVFMSTWCKSCRKEIPELNSLSARRKVLAICSGATLPEVVNYRASNRIRYPMLADPGDVARTYGVHSSPTFVRVAKGGVILSKTSHLPGGL